MQHRLRVYDGLVAGAVAAVLSGIPSTAVTVLRRGDASASTRAAGRLLVAGERSDASTLTAGVAVHAALSLGWGVALSLVLPERRTVAWGVVAGLAVAALDLGTVGRRVEAVAALETAPQVADHVTYGLVVTATVKARRARRA